MIADELDEFLDAFASYFPEVTAWLDKQSDRTIKTWRESLGSLDYQAALEALAGFHRGDLKPPPSWGLWPAAIGQQSKRTPATTVRPHRTIDGHDVYRCLLCKDSGAVLCWHPISMRAMSNKLRGLENAPHFGDRRTLYTCSIQCWCDEGRKRYPQWSPMFNDKQWVPCEEVKDRASIERLEQFIAAKRNIENHPHYHNEFAAGSW